jgi:hypothetical protein
VARTSVRTAMICRPAVVHRTPRSMASSEISLSKVRKARSRGKLWTSLPPGPLLHRAPPLGPAPNVRPQQPSPACGRPRRVRVGEGLAVSARRKQRLTPGFAVPSPLGEGRYQLPPRCVLQGLEPNKGGTA